MKNRYVQTALLAAALVSASLVTVHAFAQQAPAAAASAAEWKYKTKHLDRAGIDALLAHPNKVLFVDVRRPDEIVSKGTFPVYLNVQTKDVEKQLAFIPKDRAIVTVSNHAGRAGQVGDLLASKGFKVAGAAGSEEYEAAGGMITRITPPPPKAQ